MESPQKVIVKTYSGKEDTAMAAFRADAPNMAKTGYYPTSQSYAQGSYGCGQFILAALLCFILIGFIVFIYMMIVKPAGTLSVTYEYREDTMTVRQPAPLEKVCPQCAEKVKAEAKICRFCGHKFE